ncbi:30S ribosomal protein S3 [Candidatus Uhrbacteria bacterium]|nr:30S ribosomal protein S3 [Candidatus Uhrbacteria bacterium]
MGSKVHPKVFRLATIERWDSYWFSKANFKKYLREDVRIRAFLKKKYREASLDKITIDRSPKTVTVTLHTAKPGFIIGRAGSGVDELKTELKKLFFRGTRTGLSINVLDIGQGSLSAAVVAEQVAMDIEKRMPFRRVAKQTVDRVMKAGAEGVRIILSGRLNGAEIARRERFQTGKIPLQNLRANIQYALGEAKTMFGVIGVRVWIYKGEVFGDRIPDVAPAGDARQKRSRTPNRRT